MTTFKVLFFSWSLILGVISARGQAAFQNLGFESAVLVPIAGELGHFEFGPAFPGWTGYYGTYPATSVLYNAITLSAPNVTLFGSGPGSANFILGGQYTAALQASLGGIETSIAQVGLVPINAQFLTFRASGPSLLVSFAGQNVTYSPFGSGPNYTLYAADISAFAGQLGELRFTSRPVPFGASLDVLDSITFSPVPEPGTLGLFVLGGLVFGFNRWRFVRRK